jgi:hypothetical protein
MSNPEARLRLLGRFNDDIDKQRQMIETYIYDILVRFDTIEKYDINDPIHSIADIFNKIKDGYDGYLKQMFEASGIPYTNKNIAEILDAANLRRVNDIISEIEGPPWFEQKQRVLEPNPYSPAAVWSKLKNAFTEDIVDVQEEEERDNIKQQRLDKYKRYLESITKYNNTFARRVRTLPAGVCSNCSMLGGGFGRVKKTKKKVRRSKRKYKNVRRKNKSHRKKVY